ncbi:phosphatidylinositol-glycan biosynthesis class W protein-like isoform X2 [Centruroides sculpturatus]|uniref:phosphatidylinositol-glycan biosynthesis class W protein-like isoform X2 n=1 Tax=Centruroides sculpturatus TaxID=218467 RepID=UPI000C6E4695|nr:phosphatidylinositol-glycan biosynthesis class W protein-like isoform X2 [Centruroides sculpturatus]
MFMFSKCDSCLVMDASYKLQHEEFVSQNNGTSPGEVLLLCSVMPISSLLLHLLLLQVQFNTICQIGVEILVLVIPTVFAYTIWNDYVISLIICLVLTCFCIIIYIRINETYEKDKIHIMCEDIKNDHSRISFLKNCVIGEKIHECLLKEFRCQLLLSTIICILAVDFEVFPRSLIKTEIYGWSLMDTGVGVFVLANAFYSGHARGKKYVKKMECFRKLLKSCLPLLLLGITRMLIVKFIGYHEHVTEYGIHWNFFMTLAVTKIVCTVTMLIFPWCNCGLLSVVIITIYQYMLSGCKLNNYLFSDQRDNIFQANKEGLYSLLGYISLYFAGVELGKFFSKSRNTLQEWLKVLLTIWILNVILWIFMKDVSHSIEQVSRRTANLPYCLWMIYRIQIAGWMATLKSPYLP